VERDRQIEDHLAAFFTGRQIETDRWVRGPIERSLPGFCVRVIVPPDPSTSWVYVSDGARFVETDGERFEFTLTTPLPDAVHLETLAMMANFHADPRYRVYLGKIVDIGRPWIPGSRCDHLLVSLPYPLGPKFEHIDGAPPVRIAWLFAITRAEADFARKNGVEALERRFEELAIDTLDPERTSVV
jgi:hypothetical protein